MPNDRKKIGSAPAASPCTAPILNRVEFAGALGYLGTLLPMSILGVLLVFSGAQLALMIRDLTERKDLFVALVMLGITLTANLAAAFICGIIIAYILKNEKISI